jgi:hypothetical protein
MVTADEVQRSVRGTVDLLQHKQEALRSFDFSESGFWRSFEAIWLTLPALTVSFAFAERRLASNGVEAGLLMEAALLIFVSFCHVASFLALPVAMVFLARRLGLGRRYVPFVIVTNWVNVVALSMLSIPAVLMLLGWIPSGMAAFVGVVLAVLLLRVQWFATKLTLGITDSLAFTIVALGLCLSFVIGLFQSWVIG